MQKIRKETKINVINVYELNLNHDRNLSVQNTDGWNEKNPFKFDMVFCDLG